MRMISTFLQIRSRNSRLQCDVCRWLNPLMQGGGPGSASSRMWSTFPGWAEKSAIRDLMFSWDGDGEREIWCTVIRLDHIIVKCMYRLCNWIIIWDIRVCQNVAGCSDGSWLSPRWTWLRSRWLVTSWKSLGAWLLDVPKMTEVVGFKFQLYSVQD